MYNRVLLVVVAGQKMMDDDFFYRAFFLAYPAREIYVRPPRKCGKIRFLSIMARTDHLRAPSRNEKLEDAQACMMRDRDIKGEEEQ